MKYIAHMTILPILIHPDPRLIKNCEEVTIFNDDLRQLSDAMIATMYDAPGVGLASPQVGVLQRMFVMDCTDKEDEAAPMVVINPTISWVSEEQSVHEEGCLSIPGQYEDVTRPTEVKMSYQDITGQVHDKHFTGLWATCAQHELDHLNGVLFIDYLSRMKKSMITKKMKKLKKDRARG